MNDDQTNVEPVDLSPTRAELIARVRARGRTLRARRRLGIAGVTAVVVLAIAAPAIAIGAHSPSRSVTPATVAQAKRDFRIALILDAKPDTAATAGSCAGISDEKYCYVLGRTLVTASDVRGASVVHDSIQGWVVSVQITAAAGRRLAEPVGHQAAIIVGERVLSAPTIQAGLDARVVQVSEAGLTRAQAVALATKITGAAPASVDGQPALTATIEFPGTEFVSGAEVHGILVLENTSGAPLTLEKPGECEGKWAVTLNGPGFTGDQVWTTECSLGRRVLPPGTSRFPVSFFATYNECTNDLATAPAGSRLCLPDGRVPGLPPGNYNAVLVTSTPGYLPNAPAVPINLVAAPTTTTNATHP